MNLNNAIVATAIRAFLRRLRREGRRPDRWETEQAIRAIAFLACDRYLHAIDHIDKALVPPSKRDPVALAYIEEATSHLAVPDLATLQRILDEICDGGGAWLRANLPATDGQVVPLAREKARSGAG